MFNKLSRDCFRCRSLNKLQLVFVVVDVVASVAVAVVATATVGAVVVAIIIIVDIVVSILCGLCCRWLFPRVDASVWCTPCNLAIVFGQSHCIVSVLLLNMMKIVRNYYWNGSVCRYTAVDSCTNAFEFAMKLRRSAVWFFDFGCVRVITSWAPVCIWVLIVFGSVVAVGGAAIFSIQINYYLIAKYLCWTTMCACV